MNPEINIATRLRQIREQRNFTQTQVANAIGIEMKTYQSYEHGRAKPSVETLVKLASFYGLYSVDEVLGIAGKKEAVNNEIFQAYNDAGPEVKKIVDFILHLNH